MKKKILAGMCALMMVCSTSNMLVSADKWYGSDANGWKYQYEDGSYASKGWLKVGSKKYYITANGTRKVGWMETTTGNKYYFDKKGVMATGWWKINGDKYYFGDDGIMVTGVLTKGNKTYYFYEDGRLYKTDTIKVRKKVTTITYTSTITEYINPDGTTYEKESKPTESTSVEYIE